MTCSILHDMVADPLVWVAAVIGLGVLIAWPVIASGRREARKWDAAINAMLRHPKPSYEAFMLKIQITTGEQEDTPECGVRGCTLPASHGAEPHSWEQHDAPTDGVGQ